MRMRTRWFPVLYLVLASGLLVSGAGKDCTFLKNPDEFRAGGESAYAARSDLTSRVAMYARAALPVDPIGGDDVPRNKGGPAQRNFIDEYIFSRMGFAGIEPAPMSSDAEFLRRVSLDLTGRIPSGAEVEAFLADGNPSKR